MDAQKFGSMGTFLELKSGGQSCSQHILLAMKLRHEKHDYTIIGFKIKRAMGLLRAAIQLQIRRAPSVIPVDSDFVASCEQSVSKLVQSPLVIRLQQRFCSC